ncbi:MAG: 50S ribosomal protein L33 [bacterium]|nr:50S ribosomal protein L33 [bacterium]
MAERFIYALSCEVCKSRNYYYSRGKKKEKKVELMKYCPKCRKHVKHIQTKHE